MTRKQLIAQYAIDFALGGLCAIFTWRAVQKIVEIEQQKSLIEQIRVEGMKDETVRLIWPELFGGESL